MTESSRSVVTVLGTRPEAIKLAPVIRAYDRSGDFEATVVATAQHRELLDQVLEVFDVTPDHDLNLMRHDQGVAEFASRALGDLGPLLEEIAPDLVLVQGDTSTAMIAALAAFYQGIPVGHVEAGLRSFDKWSPFPEEVNRQIVGRLADLHFAPTEGNRENLLAEGIPADRIHVTGNPVVDAVLWIAGKGRSDGDVTGRLIPGFDPDAHRLVLVTLHRRESFGGPLVDICSALRQIVDEHEDVRLVYPVHPNPTVRETVLPRLGGHERIHLLEPLDYQDFVGLMDASDLILTDSGGVQEEAPALGVTALVLRDVTERPEGMETGAVKLVGRGPEDILREARRVLGGGSGHPGSTRAQNPYGDGDASEKIVRATRAFFGSDTSSADPS